LGFEPSTFELEVQHATLLRHGGYLVLVEELLLYKSIISRSLSFPG